MFLHDSTSIPFLSFPPKPRSIVIEVYSQYGLPLTITFALARAITVLIGATLGFSANLIFPYYASKRIDSAINQTLGKMSKLILNYVNAYVDFGVSNGPDNKPHIIIPIQQYVCLNKERLESWDVWLDRDVVGALSGIEAKIERETTAWKAGPFSLKPTTKGIVATLRVLSTRMAAFENVLRRTPVLTGAYGTFGSSMHAIYVIPLLADIADLQRSQDEVLRALGRYICQSGKDELEAAVVAAKIFSQASANFAVRLAPLRRAYYGILRVQRKKMESRCRGNSFHSSTGDNQGRTDLIPGEKISESQRNRLGAILECDGEHNQGQPGYAIPQESDPTKTPADPDDVVLFACFIFAWYSSKLIQIYINIYI